ncbi:MAG: YgiT-type zinc finger protein [Chloroflexi bacterium]|nr:YgiT-type zinc finger protein [Chloroflexota bacterium]
MNEEKPTRPCPVCKAPMEETLQDYIVPVEDGDDLIVEDVPIWLCEQCGYSEVDEEVIATIEDMLDHMDEMLEDSSGAEE